MGVCCAMQEVFDYDFSRERVFLEIAAAEMQAKEAKSEVAAASKAFSVDDDSDDELARKVRLLAAVECVAGVVTSTWSLLTSSVSICISVIV